MGTRVSFSCFRMLWSHYRRIALAKISSKESCSSWLVWRSRRFNCKSYNVRTTWHRCHDGLWMCSWGMSITLCPQQDWNPFHVVSFMRDQTVENQIQASFLQIDVHDVYKINLYKLTSLISDVYSTIICCPPQPSNYHHKMLCKYAFGLSEAQWMSFVLLYWLQFFFCLNQRKYIKFNAYQAGLSPVYSVTPNL